jgi:hypothetical protein
MSSVADQQQTDLRYPIGQFERPGTITVDKRNEWLDVLTAAPSLLRAAVADLTEPQLDTPYRPGGWTVRQLIHHIPDSHMNSYVRFRLALTEDNPTIKRYDEVRWAELADATGPLVETSLCLLDCLHQRWVALLRTLTDEQWKRTFHHPESGIVSLEQNLAIYAWHSRHHVAHITGLRQRMGW